MNNTSENAIISQDKKNKEEFGLIIVPNIFTFYGGWGTSPNPIYNPKRKFRKVKRR